MGEIKFGKLKTKYKGRVLEMKECLVTFPNGQKEIFEFCERPDSVTILAFDKKGRLLLTKERRRFDSDHASLFLPGGRVDHETDPALAAHRELREETGFDAKYLKKLYSRTSGSNMVVFHVHVFAARGLFPSPLVGDEHYPIKIVPIALSKAVKMALNGEIENEFLAYHVIRFSYMLRHGQFKW